MDGVGDPLTVLVCSLGTRASVAAAHYFLCWSDNDFLVCVENPDLVFKERALDF